jgi:hypothetical protein
VVARLRFAGAVSMMGTLGLFIGDEFK